MSVGDGDVVRSVLTGTMVNGDEFKNVFTWILEKVSLGDWTDDEIGTYLTDAIEAIFAHEIGAIKAGVSFDTVDVYLRDTGIWDYLTTKVPSITPTAGTDVMPPGVAMLATAYTALNKVFGRKFIYGACEADVSNGVLTAGGLTSLANFADEYLTSYNGGTMGPLDYCHPGVWSSKVAGFVPFNGVAIVKDTLSYQRRRKTGVGV